jgi:hypothetical protein
MKVLVCGGRDFEDKEYLFEVLDKIHSETPITRIIHGGARGADSLAGKWAESKTIPITVFHADWKTHKRAAGQIRNSIMLEEGNPDLVVAFPGGKGTFDMGKKSAAAGKPVINVPPKNSYF